MTSFRFFTFRPLLVVVIVISALAPSVQAATFYVGTTGSDSNSCSAAINPATPKRNIMSAAGGISCMKTPGDKLLVGAGNYSETIGNTYSPAALSWPSGTSWEKAFTVAAKPGEKVTVTGFAFGYRAARLGYWIVDGFEVNGGTGLVLGSNVHHIRLSNSELIRTQETAIKIYGKGTSDSLQIIGNKVWEPITDCATRYGYYGIYMNEVTDTLIDGNEFFNITGNAINLYNAFKPLKTKGTIIRNNSIHHNARCLSQSRGGILVQDGLETWIYNNLIYSNGFGSAGGAGGSGIYDHSSSERTYIYNNVIYGNKGYGIYGQNPLSEPVPAIRNNIIWNNGSGALSVSIATKQDHNLCNSGCAVTENPKFVNAAGSNFRLAQGSPAINTGANLSSLFTADFGGGTRPEGTGKWDIGAFEFGSGPPNSKPLPSSPLSFQVQ